MYRKILIPTDGSAFSSTVARAGVEFASQIKAEIMGLYVAPEYQYPVYVEVIPPTYPSEEEYQASMRKAGESYLAKIREAAEAAGLNFSGFVSFSDATAREIAHTAEQHHCDLIFMGSHGRSGWGQLLLGSVTAKVLSICQIPVLVQRLKKEAVHG